MRNFLRINLEEQYEIYTAHDGNDGWEQIRNIYPDLVVSDVMMPGMDGFELCRRSKAELLTCHIPFLLLTAKGDEENRAEGYRQAIQHQDAAHAGQLAHRAAHQTARTIPPEAAHRPFGNPDRIGKRQVHRHAGQGHRTEYRQLGIRHTGAVRDFALLLPAGLPQGQGAHRGVDQRIHPHRAAQTGGAIPRAKRHPHLGDHV